MRKIISFSLWGNDPKYIVGMAKNIDLAREFYPGWEVWVYVGCDTVFESKVAKTIWMFNDGSSNGLFWRIDAATNLDADIVIIRDADSRIGIREREAVAEFEESKSILHIMRDHPAHGAPVMGGMWGIRPWAFDCHMFGGELRSWAPSEEKQPWEGRFGRNSDQPFLTRTLWETIPISRMLIHDDWLRYDNAKPFPTVRADRFDFVGQVYDQDDNPKYEVK